LKIDEILRSHFHKRTLEVGSMEIIPYFSLMMVFVVDGSVTDWYKSNKFNTWTSGDKVRGL